MHIDYSKDTQLGIRIPGEIYKRLRVEAALRGISANRLIKELLDAALPDIVSRETEVAK